MKPIVTRAPWISMQISHKVNSAGPMGHPEIHLSWGHDRNLWNHFWIHGLCVAHLRTRSEELKSAINLLWVTLWMQHLNQSTRDTYIEHENRQLKGCMRPLIGGGPGYFQFLSDYFKAKILSWSWSFEFPFSLTCFGLSGIMQEKHKLSCLLQ